MVRRKREDDDDSSDFDEEYVPEPDDAESSTAYCPDCGAKVWDQADICPTCFTYLAGNTSRFPPHVSRRRHAFRRLVIIVLIVAFALSAGGALVFYLRRLF